MNIGIFAYGQAGCKIADRIKRFESRTLTNISAFIMAADTSSAQLIDLERIDKDWKIVYGQQQFGKTGTSGKLKPAVEAAQHTTANIMAAVNSVTRTDLDAFLVIGSLGGGTGGSGAPVCAHALSEQFPNIPVYGVGILPSRYDPDIYRFNAARSIQPFARETDNLLLFDNDHLNVAPAEYHPHIDDSASHTDVFGRVNQDIARCLHMLFSADEVTGSSGLTGATITKRELIKVLNAGGLSTMCYVTETLPREARPGITGRFWELLTYFQLRHQYKKDKQEYQRRKQAVKEQREAEARSQGAAAFDTEPEPDSEGDDTESVEADVDALVPFEDTMFSNPDNGVMGIGPDRHVDDETSTEIVLRDATTIETTGLPRVPRPGDDAYEDKLERYISLDDYLEQEWPHPTKLAPLTLDANSAMMDVPPASAMRNLFFLIGPRDHLHQSHTLATAEWAQEHTRAEYSVAKAYPKKAKKVGVMSVCSGIGLPERISELQDDAKEIAREAQNVRESDVDPKNFDVFKSAETEVPPLF